MTTFWTLTFSLFYLMSVSMNWVRAGSQCAWHENHRVLFATQPPHNEPSSLFCHKHHTHEYQAVETRAPIKKKNNDTPLFFHFQSLYSGGFLFLWSDQPEGYFSPHQLTCPAVCSVTDKPGGSARSLVPADGTAVLMGHSSVLESGGRPYRVWVIVTLSALWNAREKCWGTDEPAPWQQKQRDGSIA